MQAASIALVSLVVAAGTSLVTVKLMSDDAASDSPNTEVGALQAKVEELGKQIESLNGKLAAAKMDGGGAGGANRTAIPQVSPKQIEAAVARWMEANAKDAGFAGGAAGGKSKKKPVKKWTGQELKQAFMQITDLKLDWETRSELWSHAAKSGQLEDLLAMVKDHAAKSPNDPDAQCALGNALTNKIMQPGITGMEQATIGMQIDKAYQKALKLDKEHWEARFSRSIGMTFWPSFMGGQAKAIQNFNTLLDQQERKAPEPRFAETYVMLGNIYAQQGKTDKAKETWQRGAKIHPNNTDLKEKLKD